MNKEYVILYTKDVVIVPIKAETYPDSTTVAYCSTFPQFFGGSVGIDRSGKQHTLAGEVTEESQGKLTFPGGLVQLLKVGIYTFFRAEYGTAPMAITLDLTTAKPKDEREMQAILILNKTDFGGVFTVDKLIELCRSRGYCSNAAGLADWNASETKTAFQLFLNYWKTI